MNCSVHPEQPAQAVCCECRAGVCQGCRNKMFGRNYCDPCAASLEERMLQQRRDQPRTVVVHDAPPAPWRPPATRKDPMAAALLSVLFPGAGQLYAGKPGRGVGIFMATTLLLFVGVGVLIWGVQIFDAYQCAKEANRAAGLEPPPPGSLPPPGY